MDHVSSLISSLARRFEPGLSVEWRSAFEHYVQHLLERLITTPEKLVFDTFDAVFSPSIALKQCLYVIILQSLASGTVEVYHFLKNIIFRFTKVGREIRQVNKEMDSCTSFDEWLACAQKLDKLNGLDKWREDDTSQFYDCEVLRNRIKDTNKLIEQGDVFSLIFRLRGGISRDQFGIMNEGLFSKSLGGTKNIVHKYHETMVKALEFVCDSPEVTEDGLDIPVEAKLAFFNETRHGFGRTAMMCSGGAYLGYYHIGVIMSLFKAGMLPRVISGASAGSLMTGVIGTRTDSEFVADIEVCMTNSKGDDWGRRYFKFSDKLESHLGQWVQYYTPNVLKFLLNPLYSLIFDGKIINVDSEHFKKTVHDEIGDWTFQEAFDRTGRIINITVAPVNNYDPPRLLNYLTAPHVCVWSASVASCALPGVFPSFHLIVKEPNGNFTPEHLWTRQVHGENEQPIQNYSDGSLESDLPMKQLSELFNVNHFIVSQVNPHSALLSSLTLRDSVWSPFLYGAVVSYIRYMRNQVKDWIKNFMACLSSRSILPSWSFKRGIISVLTQDYEGRPEDITIFPWTNHISILESLTKVIKNPTTEEYNSCMLAASAATWGFMSRIKAHCQVEQTLEKCVQKLRKKIALRAIGGGSEADGRGRRQSIGGQVGRKKGGLKDRTPSFYTTPEGILYGGLSVSDPLPNMSANESLNSSQEYYNSEDDGDNSTEDSIIVDQSNYETHLSLNTINQDRRGSANFGKSATAIIKKGSDIAGNDGSVFEGDDNVVDADMPVVSPVANQKTTSMANFYYRRNPSQENLLQYGAQSSVSGWQGN